MKKWMRKEKKETEELEKQEKWTRKGSKEGEELRK